jgi:autotransporter-associated beta strand protein
MSIPPKAMKTNRSCKIAFAGLFAAAMLSTQLTSQATTIVGPYTADANTLHLWHMDASVVPVPDAVATGGTNLAKLFNGATLGTNSYTGFGTALNTLDGGQDGIAAGNTDASLTASSGASPGNVVITLADPTTGAFTMEAIVWIGFNPAKNFGLAGVGGNGRNTPCHIMTGESSSNPGRLFQFRLAPLQTANANPTVRLEFVNPLQGGVNQLMTFVIPTTGPDAIASNSWYHVAAAYNGNEGTTDNMRIYWTLLDGTRTNANQIGSTNMLNDLRVAPTVFAIGNIPGRTANANFLGVIDEVRISSVARGSNEMMFSGPVVIASQPADQSVALGQVANLSVRAAGADPLSYQWRLYVTNVPGATTNVYAIAASQPTDAGPYDVIVSNNFGAITSSVATLTVGSPVTITSQPVDQVVAVGWSTSLSVTAGGATPFSYQWRLYGTNVAGATQSAYPIASAQLTDSGPYDVVVTNSYGSITSTVATLTVRTPLNLTWLGLNSADWNTNDVDWVTDTSVNVAFTTGDNVTFDNSGSAVPSVTLTGSLIPNAVVVNAANDYTLSSSVGGGIAGVTGLTKSGAGTLVLDTDNSYTGPTLIQSGIVQLGATDNHGSFGTGPVTNNAAIVVNRTGTVSFNNTLAGTGSLTNLLGGAISIAGLNTLSGPIVLNAGALDLIGPPAAGNSSSLILNAPITGGFTTLALSGGVTLSSGVPLSLLGSTASPDSRCTLNTGNDGLTNIVNGPIVLAGDGTIQFLTGAGELDIDGTVSGPAFTGQLLLRGASGVGHIYGAINLPNSTRFSKTDGGTWVLHSAANSFTNSNVAGGTIRLAANNALPAGVIQAVEGTLDLAGFNQQVGGLTTTGPTTGIITNSSTASDSMLTVNSAQPWMFPGVLKDSAGGGTGKLGLTLVGGGTLTLTGVSTYTGDTLINAGTLALSGAGSLNSTFGSISIAAGATFDASGVTSPPYHVRTGKTLIGGGTGATIVGPLVENAGGFLALAYASGTPALNVTAGELTLSGCDTTVTVSGAPLPAGSYKLISASAGGSVAGPLPASVTVNGSGLAANTVATLRLTDGELWLDVASAVVPQPVITSFGYDGTSLIFSGTNGTAGNTYYVLASTNVTAPLINWEPIFTNTFDANGAFSVTNPVSGAIPARFYLLQLP